MQVKFLKRFSKDLDRISIPKDKKSISQIINSVKSVKNLEEVPGIKKLSGFDDAYRIRVGNYRIGIFIEGEVILFARVAHRKDIYKIFP